MKFTADRPCAYPRPQILEIAKAIEPVQDGRIREDQRAVPVKERGTPTEYRAGIKLTIECGWLWMHEKGTYVKVTQTGAELLAS